MEAAWGDTPHARFWIRLLNENVDSLINDPEKILLRHMRHDHQMVRDYQKRFGCIFEERGLNLYELIARACGEIWDNEDEEKGGSCLKMLPQWNKGMPSAWIAHVKSVYAKGKAKGMSYKQALKAASKTWKKSGTSKSKAPAEEAPVVESKKKRRKRAMPKHPARSSNYRRVN